VARLARRKYPSNGWRIQFIRIFARHVKRDMVAPPRAAAAVHHPRARGRLELTAAGVVQKRRRGKSVAAQSQRSKLAMAPQQLAAMESAANRSPATMPGHSHPVPGALTKF
jgi:hypothetical protein